MVSLDAHTAHSMLSVEQAGKWSRENMEGWHDPVPPPSCYSTCCVLVVAACSLTPQVHLYHPHTAGPVCKHTPPVFTGTF